MKDTANYQKITLNLKGILRQFDKPLVMGIINITPDSFFTESCAASVTDGLKRAEKMIQDGADIIDVGGYSSRPGADEVTESEELKRVLPFIDAISRSFPGMPVSIDSFRSRVAAEALDCGASLINDISGGVADESIFNVAGQAAVPVIIMHMRGNPQTMVHLTDYANVVKEVNEFFIQQINKAKDAGVKDIILDPGFGFSKNGAQNFELLKELNSFSSLGYPILAGISRKSMIYKTLNITASESLNGTSVLNTIALLNGASILRVHDVKEAKQAIELVGMVKGKIR